MLTFISKSCLMTETDVHQPALSRIVFAIRRRTSCDYTWLLRQPSPFFPFLLVRLSDRLGSTRAPSQLQALFVAEPSNPPREEYSRCIYVTTRWYICINCMHMRSPSSTPLSISPRPFVFLWLPPPSIDTFLRIFVALNHYIVYRYCSSPTGVPKALET